MQTHAHTHTTLTHMEWRDIVNVQAHAAHVENKIGKHSFINSNGQESACIVHNFWFTISSKMLIKLRFMRNNLAFWERRINRDYLNHNESAHTHNKVCKEYYKAYSISSIHTWRYGTSEDSMMLSNRIRLNFWYSYSVFALDIREYCMLHILFPLVCNSRCFGNVFCDSHFWKWTILRKKKSPNGTENYVFSLVVFFFSAGVGCFMCELYLCWYLIFNFIWVLCKYVSKFAIQASNCFLYVCATHCLLFIYTTKRLKHAPIKQSESRANRTNGMREKDYSGWRCVQKIKYVYWNLWEIHVEFECGGENEARDACLNAHLDLLRVLLCVQSFGEHIQHRPVCRGPDRTQSDYFGSWAHRENSSRMSLG